MLNQNNAAKQNLKKSIQQPKNNFHNARILALVFPGSASKHYVFYQSKAAQILPGKGLQENPEHHT